MRHILTLFLIISTSQFIVSGQRIVFISSYSGTYCGEWYDDHLDEDIQLMNDVFGTVASGGWERFTFNEIDSAAQFLDNTCFLYLDGFCDEWAFGDFYEIYRDDINDFVFNGGNVFINFNEDLEIVVGFDSVFRTEEYYVYTGVPYRLNHSIFNGPYNPANGFFKPRWMSAASLALGSFNGLNMDTLIINWDDPDHEFDSMEAALVERKYGEGTALIANFRIYFWNQLLDDYKNMRRNILYYLSGCMHGNTDVGVIYASNPTPECNLTDSETVGVVIYNYGIQTQTDVSVCYQLDAGEIVCADFLVNMLPQYTDTVFFSTGADFSTCGNHTIKAWTMLDGDSTAENDSLTMQIENICAEITTVGLPDTICLDAGILTAQQETGTGFWSGDGIVNSETGAFDPTVVGIDNYSVVSYNYEMPIAYNMTTIAFEPPELLNPDTLTLYSTDVDTVALGFRFNYFDNTYDSAFITSNGYISFGEPHDWFAPGLGDTIYGINNLIALVTANLNPYAGGNVIVSTQGEAPFREFIFQFKGVPFDFTWGSGTVTASCILHETTGVIDMQIKHLPENDYGIIMGLSSDDGVGIYTKNPAAIPWKKDTWNWGAQDTAFRFTPTLCPRTISDTLYVKGDVAVNVLGNDTTFCPGGSLQIGTDYPGTEILWNTGETTSHINVEDAGIYTIQMHYGPGDCYLFDTITIDATEQDVFANVLGNDTVLCYGDTLQLAINYADSIFSFQWNTADTTQIITITESGYYAIEIEYASGCSLFDTIAVNYNTPIVIESSTNPSPDDGPGGSITIDVSGGTPPYNYIWSDGLEGTEIDSVYPALYTLSVIDAMGCSADTTVRVEIATLLITNTFDAIKIYPNPFEENFIVESDLPIQNISVQSINGITMHCTYENISQNVYTISANQLLPGLYFVTVAWEDNNISCYMISKF